MVSNEEIFKRNEQVIDGTFEDYVNSLALYMRGKLQQNTEHIEWSFTVDIQHLNYYIRFKAEWYGGTIYCGVYELDRYIGKTHEEQVHWAMESVESFVFREIKDHFISPEYYVYLREFYDGIKERKETPKD